MSFKAKSSHSYHWKQIYLQKYWGCSWDRHTHREGFNCKRTEISKTFGQHTYVQVLEDGCRYLTAAQRHLGGGIHGATSVSAFVLSSWLPCWLLLRSPWGTQIPMNSHCKGNWSTRTWLLLTVYEEARYLSALSSLHVWQVHTSLMLGPLSVSRAQPLVRAHTGSEWLCSNWAKFPLSKRKPCLMKVCRGWVFKSHINKTGCWLFLLTLLQSAAQIEV